MLWAEVASGAGYLLFFVRGVSVCFLLFLSFCVLGRTCSLGCIEFAQTQQLASPAASQAPCPPTAAHPACRASITPGSPVTRGDLATAFPQSDTIFVKTLDSDTLLAVLNHAADAWTGTTKTGGAYLQLGGMR